MAIVNIADPASSAERADTSSPANISVHQTAAPVAAEALGSEALVQAEAHGAAAPLLEVELRHVGKPQQIIKATRLMKCTSRVAKFMCVR